MNPTQKLYLYNNGINLHSQDKNGNNLIHHSLLTNPNVTIILFLIDNNDRLRSSDISGSLSINKLNWLIEVFKLSDSSPRRLYRFSRWNGPNVRWNWWWTE